MHRKLGLILSGINFFIPVKLTATKQFVRGSRSKILCGNSASKIISLCDFLKNSFHLSTLHFSCIYEGLLMIVNSNYVKAVHEIMIMLAPCSK